MEKKDQGFVIPNAVPTASSGDKSPPTSTQSSPVSTVTTDPGPANAPPQESRELSTREQAIFLVVVIAFAVIAFVVKRKWSLYLQENKVPHRRAELSGWALFATLLLLSLLPGPLFAGRYFPEVAVWTIAGLAGFFAVLCAFTARK